MPTYKCLRPFLYTKKSGGLVTSKLYGTGDLVDYDGEPSDNLQPTCKEGEARRKAFDEAQAKRRREATIRNTPQGDAFADALTDALEAAFARLADKRAGKAKAETA